MIIVTPYLVRPVSGQLALPTDGYRAPTDASGCSEARPTPALGPAAGRPSGARVGAGPPPRRGSSCDPRASSEGSNMRFEHPARARSRSARRRLRPPAATTSPTAGWKSVNVPVVTRTDYVFDAAAPDGSLGPSKRPGSTPGSALDLGYGDSIYVDGAYAGCGARATSPASPAATACWSARRAGHRRRGAPGTVRVVVSRTRASVPDCPNWSERRSPIRSTIAIDVRTSAAR